MDEKHAAPVSGVPFGSLLQKTGSFRVKIRWFLLAPILFVLLIYQTLYKTSSSAEFASQFQQCSIETFLATGLSFLDSASPLPTIEFVERRNRLGAALAADDIDAFIVEPGYTFQYFGNVSQPDWEPWEPEERPFLMVIQPSLNSTTREVIAYTTFLAPSFEVGRVRLLGMPFESSLNIIPWEEHWNPYAELLSFFRANGNQRPKVMVDEEIRDFIQRGLSLNGFDVVGLSDEVEKVKQTKSQREIDLLRAVNSGSVEALRAMRSCMVPGLTETQVMDVLDNTLRAAGMEPFFDLVLFDDHASNPHGGTNGSKALNEETLVLIDVGAHLYGYSSDITRTFFPPFTPRPTAPLSPAHPLYHKTQIHSLILAAQTAAFNALIPNATAASIDIAARNVIASAGYEKEFTHRVGHGIGIKAHESPYLNQGNTEERLGVGMAFAIEPGVYLLGDGGEEGGFGVRIEDVVVIRNGGVEVLSGKRSGGPWDP